MVQQESPIRLAPLVQRTVFDRAIEWLHGTRAIIPVSLFMFVLPLAVALVEGVLDEFFSMGLWRGLLIQPTILIYISAIGPFIQHAHTRVIDSLQPIIGTTPGDLADQLGRRTRRWQRGEPIALVVGGLVGFLFGFDDAPGVQAPWLYAYHVGATIFMYAALAWVIYASIVSTQVLGLLLHQPLDVNVLDIRPFEPIGRASLMASMAFIVGATLAMMFSVRSDWSLGLGDLIAYAFFAVIAALVFFLDMRDTHRVLSNAKRCEVDLARSRVAQAYQDVKCKAMRGESIQAAVAEMNAWIACRERLEQARTWPYNVDMIRKLAISSLLPIIVAAIRQWGTALLSMIKLPF